jgi:hypothetical protein
MKIFEMKDYKGNKIMIIKYNWYMIHDIDNLIIIKKKRNMIWKDKLIYL